MASRPYSELGPTPGLMFPSIQGKVIDFKLMNRALLAVNPMHERMASMLEKIKAR